MAKAAQQPDKSAGKWLDHLTLAKNTQKSWETKGEKIVKRYKDDRGTDDNASYQNTGHRYNILWSNIRTLFPAIYGKKPKAQCERRHKDNDPVGRAAAEILERALQYEIDQYNDYDSAIKNTILDRLLPGRGVTWVRYENEQVSGQISDDTENDSEPAMDGPDDVNAESDNSQYGKECSPCDYVFWKDFRHSPARTWEEVTWVARRVYLSKEEGLERFGDDFNSVSLSHEPIGLDDLKDADIESMKKAIVWEIWDKPSKTAIWVAEGYQFILDEKPDTLGLDEFFPCPKPLYATLTSDSLIPIADYLLYQDQAKELDILTERISSLASACKVVGVYDSSQTALERMFDEGTENVMIPVSTWAAFGEKGGLKGAMDFMPLDMVITTLTQLYAAREQCKQVIYEVTGLSDIIRGASNAAETATAQQIKSQYGSLRLKDMQNDVARFASDLLRIKAQIMTKFYSDETLIEMSGISSTLDGQNQQIVMQALQLLKNDSMRNFRIEVASDSLVEIDEKGEQQSRMEFLTAASSFIEKAIQAPPELAPLLGEMLMFGVRGFKGARTIETAFDEAMQKLTAPKPQQSSTPEQQKMQAEQQQKQAEMQANMQVEQQKLHMESQARQAEQQNQAMIEQHRNQMEMVREQNRQQHEAMLADMQAKHDAQLQIILTHLNNANKLEVAEISAQTTLTAQQQSAAEVASE